MSGLLGAINTALSGLEAFESGIGTVSQNLTNQTASGYAVESVGLSTANGIAGQPGSGVQTPTISRAADGFAAGVLRLANTAGQAASTSSAALTALSNALQNNGDVQSAINQFFNDIGTLASDPSTAAAQTVLSDAGTITGAFQSADGGISTMMDGATSQLQDGVTEANNLLGQLATINKALVQSPNDPSLLDQQESALNSLSGLMNISVITQSNGEVTINNGGAVLLDQRGAQTLSLSGGTGSTPPTLSVGSGALASAVELGASDGSMGANIAAWQSGATAMQGLNTLATIFAASVNTAQAEGLTSTGAQGQPLFSVPAPSATANAANAGSASLTPTLTNPSQLPTDGGPFQLTFNGGSSWTATDQATGANYQVTPGAPPATTIAFAGMSIAVSGTPVSGDKFSVNPAPAAASGITVTATNPDAVAAADPYVATAGALVGGSISDTNGGTTAIGADSVVGKPDAGAATVSSSYYNQSLQIVFTSSSTYNVETTGSAPTVVGSGSLSNGDGSIAIAYPSSGAAAGQYWQLQFSGAPDKGDVITLQPGGSDSGSNAARMATLWTAPGTTGGTTMQQAFVNYATGLGASANDAQQQALSTASTVSTASANLQTIAGVDTNQQAVLLTNYQQAYQAVAQVISTAHSMFDSLITAVAG